MEPLSAPQRSVQLSPELWAEVLMRVEGGVSDIEWLNTEMDPYRNFAEQAAFYRLRLVCHTSNEVFKSYPELTHRLNLSFPFDSPRLPSLMLWLRQHASSVRILAAYCQSPCTEAVLGGLLIARPPLDRVIMQNPTSSSINLLASFNSLTSCDLGCPDAEYSDLNLDFMLSLTSLQKLILVNGQFTAMQLPHNLDKLYLQSARLQTIQNCQCLRSLKILQMSHSQLVGVHTRGVLACSNLEQLLFYQSVSEASLELSQFKTISGTDFQVPAALSSLTCMTHLALAFGKRDADSLHDMYDLTPLWELTSLEQLSVMSCGPHLEVTSGLTALTRVTSVRYTLKDVKLGLSVS